jgi:maltooligosyltrehalose synthase
MGRIEVSKFTEASENLLKYWDIVYSILLFSNNTIMYIVRFEGILRSLRISERKKGREERNQLENEIKTLQKLDVLSEECHLQ